MVAEGVFIDAIGATVAVVALEAFLVHESIARGAIDVVLTIGVGALVGGLGGGVLAALLHWRNIVPEGLANTLALAFSVAVFHISNALFHESGITAVIVAGMVVTNMRSPVLGALTESVSSNRVLQ